MKTFAVLFVVAGLAFQQASAQLFNFGKKEPPQQERETEVSPNAPAAPRPAGEEEEVVTTTLITRKKSGVVPAQAEAPPPPPEPSAQDASEPKRIVRYFCLAWKDEEYEKMYWAMDAAYRKGTSLKKFTELFENDKAINGGLEDENLAAEEKKIAADVQLKLTLNFRSKRAKSRDVFVRATKTPNGYRIVKSGIIPVDLDDL